MVGVVEGAGSEWLNAGASQTLIRAKFHIKPYREGADLHSRGGGRSKTSKYEDGRSWKQPLQRGVRRFTICRHCIETMGWAVIWKFDHPGILWR